MKTSAQLLSCHLQLIKERVMTRIRAIVRVRLKGGSISRSWVWVWVWYDVYANDRDGGLGGEL